MKNPIQQFRRFFFRGKKFNTSATRPAMAAPRDDDDDGHQLSGAFVVVLILHVIAIVGVFAFARINEKHKSLTPPDSPALIAAGKANPAKPIPPKPAPAKPVAPVAVATPAPVVPATPAHDSIKAAQPGQPRTHIVQGGETLTKIAFAFGVNVEDLVGANKLRNKDDIRNGQALTIPEGKSAVKNSTVQKPPTPANDRKTSRTYIVKKGDSAAKIARENGCTYDELVKLNSIRDPKKIQAGQVLKLPLKNF